MASSRFGFIGSVTAAAGQVFGNTVSPEASQESASPILSVSLAQGQSFFISGPAQPEDIEALVTALLRLEQEYYGAPSVSARSALHHRSWLQQSMRDSEHCVHVLKDVHGNIAATACLEPDESNRQSAVLHSVWVNPQFRGHGLGRRIAEAVVARAKEMGYTAVTMPPTTNPIAQKLYESMGFAVVPQGLTRKLIR